MNLKVVPIAVNIECNNCWDIFLNALKVQFPDFAMYQPSSKEFYFQDTIPLSTEQSIQPYVDIFNCVAGEQAYLQANAVSEFAQIVKTTDPTITENLEAGTLWLNKTKAELFVCMDETTDKNVWRGLVTSRIISPIPPANKFDFFQDGSAVSFLNLDGDTTDLGGLNPGVASGVRYVDALDNQGVNSNGSGQIRINAALNTSGAIVASAWVKWNGTNSVMPYGMKSHDLYLSVGELGFNTFRGDVYGLDFTPYENKWCYLTAIFRDGQYGDIYIDGVKQVLTQRRSTILLSNAIIDNTFCIFGVTGSTGYRNFGTVDRFRLFSRELTEIEIGQLYLAEKNYIDSIGAL